MGMDKSRKGFKKGAGRDGGGFVALPWSALDCPAYSRLSHPARSLLIEFARQYVQDNNGRLLASGKYLSKRGWRSSDVIQRAKMELIELGFIYETVKGHRPNKASWYAITWQNLDKHTGYDAGAFEGWREARSGYAKSNSSHIKVLTPPKGVDVDSTVPSSKVVVLPVALSDGAITLKMTHVSTPSHGNHLDIPSSREISGVR